MASAEGSPPSVEAGQESQANGRILYLDSSALVKLVLPEPESEALLRTLGEWPMRASSFVAKVEVPRAIAREDQNSALFEQGERVLAGLALVHLDLEVAQAAAELAPVRLRSLDAIHFASALSLGDDLGAFAAYDTNLIAAAQAVGAPVLSPA